MNSIGSNVGRRTGKPGQMCSPIAADDRFAWELGSKAERGRIAQDLHDDVIPPLLSFIYRTDDLLLADEARGILQRLREILGQLDRDALA